MAENYDDMDYRELQQAAQEKDIPANQSEDELRAALKEAADQPQTDTSEGDGGTQDDADRSQQRPAPGDPREPDTDARAGINEDPEKREQVG